MTENQRLSPDTTVAVLRKPDPNSERGDGESDVEAATEVVCQEKRQTEAGDTEVTGNQRVSSDATDAVPRKTDGVLHKTDPTPERREKEEKALRASSGGFPEDEVYTGTETTPGESNQLMGSGAKMQEIAVQQSSQDPDRSDRHPCGLGTKPTAPSQESKQSTRREVIEIFFDDINQSCLVRLRCPYSRPFTETRCKEDIDEYASGSESSSRLGDGRPQAGRPRGPAIFGGCANKGPAGDKMEPGRDKADPTQVHLRTSSCSWHWGSETENSDAVTSQRPRRKRERHRRISVVRSCSNASCKEQARKARRAPLQKEEAVLEAGRGKTPGPLSQRATDSQLKDKKGAWKRCQGAWDDSTRLTEAQFIARGSAWRHVGRGDQGRSLGLQLGALLEVQGEELEQLEWCHEQTGRGVNRSLDFSRQPSRETASFRGPAWTAPPQDTLPGGGGAVVKGPGRQVSPYSSITTGGRRRRHELARDSARYARLELDWNIAAGLPGLVHRTPERSTSEVWSKTGGNGEPWPYDQGYDDPGVVPQRDLGNDSPGQPAYAALAWERRSAGLDTDFDCGRRRRHELARDSARYARLELDWNIAAGLPGLVHRTPERSTSEVWSKTGGNGEPWPYDQGYDDPGVVPQRDLGNDSPGQPAYAALAWERRSAGLDTDFDCEL
ncbi:hypothetical protein HPB47_010961 [Ixodes persulcatus]|uniref:Uncharacterized protein n=1 Tax=Ixodes persulcatus TaxID=34615 RepID=A0AC60NXJ8_IXOPE|nr:hypothetical protein HPB47_010961 [Ixodes persulcatus]